MKTTVRTNSQACSACHHAPVCALKKSKAELEKELADKGSLMENKNFFLRVDCDHYEREADTVR